MDDAARARRSARIAELRRLSGELVDRLADRLAPATLDDSRTLLSVGEWVHLLDNLCAALVKRQIAITVEERDVLAAALEVLGSGYDPFLSYIADKPGTLAALNVTKTTG